MGALAPPPAAPGVEGAENPASLDSYENLSGEAQIVHLGLAALTVLVDSHPPSLLTALLYDDAGNYSCFDNFVASLLFSRDGAVRQRGADGLFRICRLFSAYSVVDPAVSPSQAEPQSPLFVLAATMLGRFETLYSTKRSAQLIRTPGALAAPLELRGVSLAYFYLLSCVFEECSRQQLPHASSDYLQKVWDSFARKVVVVPGTEHSADDAPDEHLCGILRLCTSIVRLTPQLKVSPVVQGRAHDAPVRHFVDATLRTCLFSAPEYELLDPLATFESDLQRDRALDPRWLHERVRAPLCRSDLSRRLAYAAVLECCRGCPQACDGVIHAVVEQHRADEILQQNVTGWRYLPHSDKKSGTGLVGLRNLGCTCYLNATLQQLFMTRPFRRALLSR